MSEVSVAARAVRSYLPALAIAATVITWAASFPAITVALRSFEPLPLAAVRFALASCLALAWLAWKKPPHMSRRDYGIVAACGLLGIAMYNVLLNIGQTTVSSGAASFIINIEPLLIACLAVFFFREHFNRWNWYGSAVGLIGVGTIAWGQPGGIAFGAGSSLVVVAAFCAAAFSVLQRPLLARSETLQVTALIVVAGTLALLPWLPAGVSQLTTASTEAISAVVFLAVAPGAIGYSCWAYAIRTLGAARAGQFLYLIPPVTMLLSWMLLGEAPQWSTLLGGVLALAGVILASTWGAEQGSPTSKAAT